MERDGFLRNLLCVGSPFHLNVLGRELPEGSGVSLTDSLADSVRQAQAADLQGYVSSDDDASLGDYTRPPPTPQAPLVPLPPSRLPTPPVPAETPGTPNAPSTARGRVLAQITQFEKQAKVEEPIAGRRASEKWLSLRTGTQEGVKLGGIKETAVAQLEEKAVDKVPEPPPVDKIPEPKAVDKVPESKAVERAAAEDSIQRGVVSSLVKRSEEIHQRASIFGEYSEAADWSVINCTRVSLSVASEGGRTREALQRSTGGIIQGDHDRIGTSAVSGYRRASKQCCYQ